MTVRTPVTIVVPVYRGLDDVRRCVESVLRHAPSHRTPAELLLIDDASPEPEVSEYVRSLDGRTSPLPVRSLVNAQNRGFVATVNRGLDHAPGDAVVLNADTVVTSGWLDRLRDAAEADDVATVTPLTNFGSLCTLPMSIIEAFGLDTDEPQIDACAAFIADNTVEMRPEVISGVGFCLYVTREALDVCGPLDEETFGRGYGEEVDFCLRAGRAGFRHLVEDSTFVYHRGGGSFGAERDEGLARGSALLHERYGFFRAANRRERKFDPLAIPFAALELGLYARDPERPHVLQVLHSPPGAIGGTEKHLFRLMTTLFEDIDFSTFYPVESGFVLRTYWRSDGAAPREIEFLLPGGARRAVGVSDPVAVNALQTALSMFRFDAVHIHNLVGHTLAPFEALRDFDGPVVCSVRDLYLACPHHWLLYRNQQACGIPADLDVCARCLPETQRLSVDHLVAFRERVREHLDTVDHWVFASQSAADYFLRVYEPAPESIHLIEHGAIIPVDPHLRRSHVASVLSEPLRLGFVGIGWTKKGLDVVNALAEHPSIVDTSIELHHFGPLKAPASPRIRLHGSYDNELLPHLLDITGVHVVLLPGPYAETFGHAMTEAMLAARPVIAASYGALGERIRRHRAGWTIDPEDVDALAALVRDLDRCRIEVLRASEAAASAPSRSVASTAPMYAALYGLVAGDPPLPTAPHEVAP